MSDDCPACEAIPLEPASLPSFVRKCDDCKRKDEEADSAAPSWEWDLPGGDAMEAALEAMIVAPTQHTLSLEAHHRQSYGVPEPDSQFPLTGRTPAHLTRNGLGDHENKPNPFASPAQRHVSDTLPAPPHEPLRPAQSSVLSAGLVGQAHPEVRKDIPLSPSNTQRPGHPGLHPAEPEQELEDDSDDEQSDDNRRDKNTNQQSADGNRNQRLPRGMGRRARRNHELHKKGLCVWCKKSNPTPQKKGCPPCRQHRAACTASYRLRLQERKRQEGQGGQEEEVPVEGDTILEDEEKKVEEDRA